MSRYPKIWFLRHGQTFWNAERRIQGQLESDLTPKGIQDAEIQARLIQPIVRSNVSCFASPLSRAQQTAAIALGGANFAIDARLTEAYAGDWQGLLQADVRRDNRHLVDAQTPALQLFLSAPGSEGFPAFRARIQDFLDDLNQPSVVVAHGLLGQVLRGLVCGLDQAEMGRLPNEQACIYVLENGVEMVMRQSC